MDEWQSNIISRKAKEIRDKMIGGAIYGVPVTGDDAEVMIVAAYHLGRAEEMRDSVPDLFNMMYTTRR